VSAHLQEYRACRSLPLPSATGFCDYDRLAGNSSGPEVGLWEVLPDRYWETRLCLHIASPPEWSANRK
jgi:hypothetical protein